MAKLHYGQVGPKAHSYSRLQTLHKCPRKWQLENIFGLGQEDNIDFAFGHSVATGMQHLVKDPNNLNFALLEAAKDWSIPIAESDFRRKKGFAWAVRAVQKFHTLLHNPHTNFLRDWEVATFVTRTGEVKPAIELFFKLEFEDGHIYEGHIDLILKHKKQEKYMVLEAKTTVSSVIHEATYKNSNQAVGYSLILDRIAHNVNAKNSYAVMYLIYKSTKEEWEAMPFQKSKVDRAEFLNSVLIDIETVTMYEAFNFFPKRGETCYDFFRPCPYFESCHLSDEILERTGKARAENNESHFEVVGDDAYDFIFTQEEVVELLQVS